MNFSVILSRTTYSLNVMAILFSLKLTAPLTGTLLTTVGGSLSLGPPVGELTFAHPAIRINTRITGNLCLNMSGHQFSGIL